MAELIAYLNGEYVPISQCKVSVMDIGITTGSSVTDMVRTFNGEIFPLEINKFFRADKYS